MSGVQIKVRFGRNIRVRRQHLQEAPDHHTQPNEPELPGVLESRL